MAETEQNGGNPPLNPMEPAEKLAESSISDAANVNQTDDAAVTKAEKYERHGVADGVETSPSKRRKLDMTLANEEQGPTRSERQKGVAPIKSESVPPSTLEGASAYNLDNQVPRISTGQQERQRRRCCR